VSRAGYKKSANKMPLNTEGWQKSICQLSKLVSQKAKNRKIG